MGFSIANMSRNAHYLKFLTKKHSPLLLTIGGIAGVGLTGFLAYRAAKEITTITEEVKSVNAAGQSLNRRKVIWDITKAVLPPASVGLLSVAAIFGSYSILTNRNTILAGVVSTLTAENSYIKEKIKAAGQEALFTPGEVTTETIKTKDENGKTKKKEIKVIKRVDIPQLDSVWFDESTEYAYDDHAYNQDFIRRVERSINEKQGQKGAILLNELFDELGIPRRKSGALFGWYSNELISLTQTVMQERDAEGNFHPQILITWPEPHYVYDIVAYGDSAPF